MQERQRKGEKDRDLLVADILAYRSRFKEAARLYQRAGQEHRALNMYTDLRMFDQAQVNCTNETNELLHISGYLVDGITQIFLTL